MWVISLFMFDGFEEVLDPRRGAVACEGNGDLVLLFGSDVHNSQRKMLWHGLRIEGIDRDDFNGDLDGCLFYDSWRSYNPNCIGYVSEGVVERALVIANSGEGLR